MGHGTFQHLKPGNVLANQNPQVKALKGDGAHQKHREHGQRTRYTRCLPGSIPSPQRPTGRSCTCCFMAFVSHSSSLPGTWFVPLLPRSGAKESAWEVRLGAAAEQTKEAPLGLQARDRILQHTQARVRQSPAQALGGHSWRWGPQSSCRGGF